MGGSVAFSIKKHEQIQTREFSKQAVHAVSSLDFFQGKGEVMKHWATEEIEQFAPIGYGLVAVDFDRKWVGAIQDFCSLEADYFYNTDSNFRSTAKDLFNSGRLRGFRGEDYQTRSVEGLDFDTWFAVLKKYQKKTRSSSVCLDIAPPKGWEFKQFSNDAPGWQQLVENLIERDWLFDKAAFSGWTEFLKEKELPVSIINAAKATREREKLDVATPLVVAQTLSRRF